MDTNLYIPIDEFAKYHNVPIQAVLNAIQLNRIKPYGMLVNNQPAIPIKELDNYRFELIGIYEYAERKGVTFNAIYKRIDRKQMLYCLEEFSDIMKIDWELYKDEKFRSFKFKHRKRNKVA